jgi:hypothetical protein
VVANDPDLLAHALTRTLTDCPTVDGRAAVVRQGLDIQTVARRILSIYQSVLVGRGNAGR